MGARLSAGSSPAGQFLIGEAHDGDRTGSRGLIIALCVVSFLIWDAWQTDYGRKPPPRTTDEASQADKRQSEVAATDADVPQAPRPIQDSQTAVAAPRERTHGIGDGRKVRVTTDVLVAEIDSLGGTISRVDLRTYPVSIDSPKEPFRLLDDADPNRFFIAQSGLTGPRSAPNHHTQFQVDADAYELTDGVDVIDVPLRWRSDDGVEVIRTFRFTRDRYVVDVRLDVANRGSEAWQGALYGQLQRGEPESEGGLFRTYTYTGGILSGPEKPYEKVDFSDMESRDVDRDVPGAG